MASPQCSLRSPLLLPSHALLYTAGISNFVIPLSRSRKLWAEYLRNPASRDTTPQAVPAVASRGRKGIFLGIDPSLRGTGLALLDCRKTDAPVLLFSETIRIGPKPSMTTCLGMIYTQVDSLLEKFSVDEIAVEQAIYVQNFQTAMTLGSARGAALASPSRRQLPITEYPPLRVKQAIVGYGRASKEQMIRTLQQMLRLPHPLPSDEADAAGVALCHAFTATS
jgi:crossover junction endodeoxyribonuclease RuvC